MTDDVFLWLVPNKFNFLVLMILSGLVGTYLLILGDENLWLESIRAGTAGKSYNKDQSVLSCQVSCILIEKV